MAEILPGSENWLDEIEIPDLFGSGLNIIVVDCNNYLTRRIPELKPESTFDNMISVTKHIISKLGPRDGAIVLANHMKVDRVDHVRDLIRIAENKISMARTSYLEVFRIAAEIAAERRVGFIHVVHPGSTLGEPQDAVIKASRTILCPILSYYIGTGSWHEIAFHDNLRKPSSVEVL
jgi:hypothetical protein